MTIGRKKLVDSQFPEAVQKRDGYIITKPLEWYLTAFLCAHGWMLVKQPYFF